MELILNEMINNNKKIQNNYNKLNENLIKINEDINEIKNINLTNLDDKLTNFIHQRNNNRYNLHHIHSLI